MSGNLRAKNNEYTSDTLAISLYCSIPLLGEQQLPQRLCFSFSFDEESKIPIFFDRFVFLISTSTQQPRNSPWRLVWPLLHHCCTPSIDIRAGGGLGARTNKQTEAVRVRRVLS